MPTSVGWMVVPRKACLHGPPWLEHGKCILGKQQAGSLLPELFVFEPKRGMSPLFSVLTSQEEGSYVTRLPDRTLGAEMPGWRIGFTWRRHSLLGELKAPGHSQQTHFPRHPALCCQLQLDLECPQRVRPVALRTPRRLGLVE